MEQKLNPKQFALDLSQKQSRNNFNFQFSKIQHKIVWTWTNLRTFHRTQIPSLTRARRPVRRRRRRHRGTRGIRNWSPPDRRETSPPVRETRRAHTWSPIQPSERRSTAIQRLWGKRRTLWAPQGSLGFLDRRKCVQRERPADQRDGTGRGSTTIRGGRGVRGARMDASRGKRRVRKRLGLSSWHGSRRSSSGSESTLRWDSPVSTCWNGRRAPTKGGAGRSRGGGRRRRAKWKIGRQASRSEAGTGSRSCRRCWIGMWKLGV